uniref:Ig-like domain-containing protein n=1 Tax=Astyanax mexicanus TaxID=7994 RepID=A0A3B1J8V6_ASTMX
MGEEVNSTVLIGRLVELHCQSDAIPPPTLSWLRPSISPSEHGSGEVMVVRGGNVTLQCEVDGVPRPAVTWLKDGRPLGAVARAQVLSEGRLLYIKDAQVAHTGRYTCIAVNIAGQADNKYDVTVHGKNMYVMLYIYFISVFSRYRKLDLEMKMCFLYKKMLL